MARTSSRDAAKRSHAAGASTGLGKSLFPDVVEAPDPADHSGAGDAADSGQQGAAAAADPDGEAGIVVPNFDQVRAGWSGVGLALYALEPGGDVTLEIHSQGQVYQFTAPTAQAAFAIAFPPAPPPNDFG